MRRNLGPPRRKRRRGSILAGAMALVFMLLTVVLAMHHYQALSRQTYMTAEAELRFREGLQHALFKATGAGDTGKSTLVSVDMSGANSPLPFEKAYGAKIFDRKNGLPNLLGSKDAGAHSYIHGKPKTSDVSLRIWGNKTYEIVLSRIPGYAAYAPNGNVDIEDLRGWSNPSYQEEDKKSTESYSGNPAIVAAKKDATSKTVTYGELHVVEGTAKITESSLGGCFKAPKFPFSQYETEFIAGIKSARDSLSTVADGADKTKILIGNEVGIGAVLDLFFGGHEGFQSFISLKNALNFPMPTIPTISLTAPPYFMEVFFHVPLPPDGVDYENNPTARALKDKIEQLSEKLKPEREKADQLKKEAEAAKAAWDADPADDNKKLAFQLAQKAYDDQVNKMKPDEQALEDAGKQLLNMAQGQGTIKIPPTRKDDPDGDNGITGWNYSKTGDLFAAVGGLLVDALTFQFDKMFPNLCNKLIEKVKTVHFGRTERAFQFNFETGNVALGGTLTVPRGRSMKLRNPGFDITVAGDVWLQRGSTLVLDCKTFSVQGSPPTSGAVPDTFFYPHGRLFLEEGATLVCSGDVIVPGHEKYGSLVIGGVPGQIHPITSAVFANNVRFDRGIYAGCTFDDMAIGLGVGDVADKFLIPLLNKVAPNAAKILGPFHARKSYFASYATTFQFGLAPGLFGAPMIPYVTPIPLPRKNALNQVSRGFNYAFQVLLNLNLGENFYTNSEWWLFGDGVVPMVPQVNPKAAEQMLKKLPSLSLDSIDPASLIGNVVQSILSEVIKTAVTDVLVPIITKLASSAVPYAGTAISAAIDEVAPALTNFATKITKGSSPADGLVSALFGKEGPVSGATQYLQTQLDTLQQDIFMREYNGVLVYAADGILIGGKTATGMFVAEKDIQMNAERCAGTLLSHSGNIKAKSLLYYPFFNQASLFKPAAINDPTNLKYDADASNEKQAFDVLPPQIPATVTAEGWIK